MLIKRLFVATLTLSLMLFALASHAQTRVVSGTVTDSKDGTPLSGVTVSAKGTTIATQTNATGAYSLNVPASVTTLVFTSVGFGTQELLITGDNVNASLLSTTAAMENVVVIGYGTARKRDLTGSVSQISTKDFNKGMITTPEQLISGKAAGVAITPNDGAPGSGSQIRIRGGASLNASNDPLIVVDGMPITNDKVSGVANALSLINPNDIASISILKDASATAIYGSRASNGVVMITTKKGQKGKPRFNFTSQLTAGKIFKQFSVLSPSQFRDLVNQYGTTAQKALLGDANTNWQDEIYRLAIGTDNNLSISGSVNKLPYRVSVGYLNQNGVLKTGNMQRGSVGLNLNPTLLDQHLKIDFNVKASYTKSQFANTGAIGGANRFDPTQPVMSGSNRYFGYWERLDPTNTITGLASLSPKNPLGLLHQQQDIGNAMRLITNAVFDYKMHFLPDLHAILNIGYDYTDGAGSNVVSDSAAGSYRWFKDASGNYHGGSRTKYKKDFLNPYGNFNFSYSKDIDNLNRVEALAGVEYQDYKTKEYFYNAYTYDNLVTGSPTYPFDIQENRLLSFLGRVNYVYNNFLFLTASFRRDGSSRFSPEHRWGNFPSAAAAIRLKEISGLKEADYLSELKFRVGYGVTGQQDGLGNYEYISYYFNSNDKANYLFGNNFYQMIRPGGYDPNRRWEQTATTNFALDYGFLDNRINGSLEFYVKNTKDLLNRITQPAFTNFSNTIIANVGTMQNRGVEFTVNFQPVRSADLTWDVSFNATYNKNKITNLTISTDPNAYNQIAGVGGLGGVMVNRVGYPRGSFFVFKQIYDEATGKPIENLFVDWNKDGILNTSDLYAFKSYDPKAFFGLSSSLAYKKWTASTTLRANLGNYLYNQVATDGAISKFLFSSYLSNQNSDVLNTLFQGVGNFYQSNYYVQNASFLKMDNINVGYNVGRIAHNALGLRLNAGVQNVFTVTKYKGLDPEVNGGIDNNQYPRPTTFIFGIGLDF